ncbi:MAG TPA: hypothetical protein VFF06_11690 [Polyangia bacterium]|nr:hypothetical protein [Polyangia bacterium]
MKRIAGVLAALSLGVVFAACGDAPESCGAFGGSCAKGGTIKSCCTPDYTICDVITSDGTDFSCEGSDCSGAYTMAADWCRTH